MLFCGTGSVERQFSKQFPGCEVVSVDIQNRWKPTHCENILHWDYRQFSPKHFDVIWASPPCTEYSQAKTVGVRNLRGADKQVRRTLEIIKYLQPSFYFIENPRGRAPHGLHTRRCMQGLPPPHLATYCKYGMPYKKPTHFWTNAPITTLKSCDPENPCDFKRRYGRHEKMAQSGSASRESGDPRPGMGAGWHVYGIPAALLKQLFSSLPVEQPAGTIAAVCEYLAEMLWRDEDETELNNERVCANLEEADGEPVTLMPEYNPTPPPVMSDDSEWDTMGSESA